MRNTFLRYALISAALVGCTVKDPLFCDDTHPCVDPTRSYCDRTGDYEPQHIGNTCVASPFDAAPPADAAPSAATLMIDKDTFDFQDVQMGAESFAQQFIVTNAGELPSGAIAVTLGGSNAGSFVVVPTGDASDCQGKQLGAHDTCIAQVKYHPGAPGPESAVLHVDADPGGMPIVGLSGNSLAPGSLEVTAGSSLDFGNLTILSMSGTKTVTVHNNGGVACMNLGIALKDTSNYKQVSTTCTASLSPNASCDVNLQFTPQSVGAHASSITISSDQGSVAPQLSGSGTSTVTVNKAGTGSVSDTLATPIVSCGTTCSGAYDSTPITLHATVSGTIPFDGWGGACASAGKSADCTLSLTQPSYSVSATFGVCAPGTGMCANGMLSTCDSTGHWGTATTCALGCYTDNTRCWDVDPSNGLAAELDASAGGPDLVLTDGATINTSSGIVKDGNGAVVTVPYAIVAQTNGPSIAVFEVKSAHIGTTRVTGTNAVALASNGDVVITGEFSAYSDSSTATAGPGANYTYCPVSGGNGGTSFTPMGSTQFAGGGGGKGRRGGNNGTVLGGAAGADGGNISLIPLVAGCDGGGVTGYSGGMFPNIVAIGAFSGGAVQIVSRTKIVVQASGGAVGSINVGGGGGMAKGGGGGSGGGILLEAPQVTVTGAGAAIAANGGGGGGGCTSGMHGLPSTNPAPGGSCSGSTTSGGNGRTSTTSSSAGVDFASGTPGGYAGGGGGGLGNIAIKTVAGASVINGAVASGFLNEFSISKR